MKHLTPPGRCPVCRALHAFLSRPETDSRTLRTHELSAALDRAPRTLRVHLTVMVDAGWIAENRRTPVPGQPAGPPAVEQGQARTPHQWAATTDQTCRACHRVLVVLAGRAGPDWTARGVTRANLADTARMSTKTWSVHIGHLEDVGLLRVESSPPRPAQGRRVGGREPDQYVLRPQRPATSGEAVQDGHGHSCE